MNTPVTITFNSEEFSALLQMTGYAIGAAARQGDDAEAFRPLANQVRKALQQDPAVPVPTSATPPAIVTSIKLPLDDKSWTDEWDTSINLIEATAYGHLGTPEGLLLQMYHEGSDATGDGYGGWLCKNVCRPPLLTKTMVFEYIVVIDDATLQSAQVIETDHKTTDAAGWTYDGSLQFNIADNWMVEISAPWKKTGIRVPAPTPGVPMQVSILYTQDYAAHTITFVSITVDGAESAIGLTYNAQQVGWAPGEIVTQLQQCNRSIPGGYTLKFPRVGYLLQ
jgi:hypothetical protein